MRAGIRWLIAALIVVLTMAAPVAAEDGPPGNSGAAQKCQAGGWQTWKRSDGTGFSNVGQCVSYAAQGGTLSLPCTAGSWSTAGVTPCTPASAGYYVSTAGATSQTQCSAGTYQPSTSQTSCLAADAGHYVDSTGATSQTPCAAGSYQPSAGETGCPLADVGYYVDSTGATAQTPCPAGQTTDSTGSTSADDCRAEFVSPSLTVDYDVDSAQVTVEGAGLDPDSQVHITIFCSLGCDGPDVAVASDGSFSYTQTLECWASPSPDDAYVEASGTTADGDPITSNRVTYACGVQPGELVVDGAYNGGTGQWTFTITGSGLSDESPVTVDACTVYDCGTPVPPPAVVEGSFSFTFSTTQCGDLPDYYVKATGTSASGEVVTSNTFAYPCPVELLTVTYDLGSAQLTVEGAGLDPGSTVHITIACPLGCDGPDVPVEPGGSFFYTQTLECWAGGSPDDTYVEAYGTTADGDPASSNRVPYGCPFGGGGGGGDG